MGNILVLISTVKKMNDKMCYLNLCYQPEEKSVFQITRKKEMHCKGKTNSENNRTKGRIKMRKMIKTLQNTEILSRFCIGNTTR